MKSKSLDKQTYALVFDKGDEVTDVLLDFARQQALRAAHFTGIGAFSDCVLGYFEKETKDYRQNPIDEQVEVMSLIGNIARTEEGTQKVHAHAVVGKYDGTANGGHLLEGHVWPTLEMVLVASPQELIRRDDEETGLPLIAIK